MISELFNSFDKLNMLIIGDVMIDAYLWGRVDRISPEAPVPIVSVTKKEYRLGGAANVALNLQALGATPFICALVGDDKEGDEFIQLLKNAEISNLGIVKIADRPTTVKTRVIGHNQQILRIDAETDGEISRSNSRQRCRCKLWLALKQAFNAVLNVVHKREHRRHHQQTQKR